MYVLCGLTFHVENLAPKKKSALYRKALKMKIAYFLEDRSYDVGQISLIRGHDHPE
jgi:hypothetical protein